MKEKKNKMLNYLILQFSFFIYALSSFFSKMSTYNNDNIFRMCCFYSLSILFLGVYAIIWQQVLKRMSLSVAFSNKGITILWGLLLGVFFFNEHITIGKIVGIIIVIIGIIILMYNTNIKEKDNE